MQRKTILMFIIAFLLVIITTLILLFVYDKEHKVTFYVTVKEVNGNSYLVNPFPNEKINYSEINLVITDNNYQPGDILKITAKDQVMETYPVTMHVISSILLKKDLIEETTVPVKDIIEEPDNQNQEDNNLNEELVINEISSYLENVNSSSKDQAKNNFINVVDFIFYEKEISGLKFAVLTNKTKIAVIKLALELDNAINLKFPNHKNNLSSEYKIMKGKLVVFYLEKTNEFCQNNDTVCEEAKSTFQVLKKSLNLTWSFITSIGETGVNELQNWYEIYRGN